MESGGNEGFCHVEENFAGEPLFAEIPDYSFNEAGQLQRRAMPGLDLTLTRALCTSPRHHMFYL